MFAQSADTCFTINTDCFVILDGSATGTWVYERTPPPLAPSPSLPYICAETDLKFNSDTSLQHPSGDRNAQKCAEAVGKQSLNWKVVFDLRSNKSLLRIFSGDYFRDYLARFQRNPDGTVQLILSTIIPESPTQTFQTHYYWQSDDS